MTDKSKSLALSNALEFFQGSDFAATTYLNKYALKDENGDFLETDPQQTINRVMKVLAKAMPEKNGKPSEDFLKRVFGKDFEEVKEKSWYNLFVDSCGKFEGVCPQGSVLSAAGNKKFPQSLSNCFVIDSPHDSIAGIMKTAEQESQLMKKRGGVGIDISTLRPAGTHVANAARTSTGASGWMDHFSNVCRSIGQNGRRGALMLSIDVKHPDALLFAQAKLDEKYCTGANVSIKITDEFMKAVKKGGKYTQQWPVDSDTPEVVQKIDARELWKEIIKCAWTRAEPGILLWDNITKNLPAHCYPQFKTISTNPCGEIPLSPYDSCRLTTICLTKYVDNKFTDKAIFNKKLFERDVRIAMRMMDAVVTAEINHIDGILKKLSKEKKQDPKGLYDLEIDLWKNIKKAAVEGRRTGLGAHGLGDCLAQLTLRYDSPEAVKMVKNIYRLMRDSAYDESVEMAKEYGAFEVYDPKIERDCAFLSRLPKAIKDKMKKYGRRNISLLTTAPAGSISIMSLCSSGMEPTFQFMFLRRRKINPSDTDTRVDYICELGDKWSEHPQFEKNIERYFEATGKELPDVKTNDELYKLLPDYFITSDKINWKMRVEVQAAAQESIDHSISSTINLPSDVSEDEVRIIYEHAYTKGLKGVTVYRDGCRSGVLLTTDGTSQSEERPTEVRRTEAPKRPEKLPCEVHFTKVKGKDYVVIVGLLNGAVYEVFFGEYHNQIPKKSFSGWVEKKGKTKYYLTYIEGVELKQVDINKYFDNKDYASATRLLSMALRHGAPLEYVIDQLQKSSPNIVEFGSALSRILKKYIKIEDIQKSYVRCKTCDSSQIEVKLQEGCVTVVCSACGMVDAKCG